MVSVQDLVALRGLDRRHQYGIVAPAAVVRGTGGLDRLAAVLRQEAARKPDDAVVVGGAEVRATRVDRAPSHPGVGAGENFLVTHLRCVGEPEQRDVRTVDNAR